MRIQSEYYEAKLTSSYLYWVYHFSPPSPQSPWKTTKEELLCAFNLCKNHEIKFTESNNQINLP